MTETRAAFAALEETLEEKRLLVEEALARLQPGRPSSVAQAAAYSLFAPAKRLRPVLALLVADVLEGDARRCFPRAARWRWCTPQSLILDDCPRWTTPRGDAACHVVHGESTAILAAFALQNRAFEILAEGWSEGPPAAARAELARELARAIGLAGMIAGQAKDLEMTDRPVDFHTLEFIHSRKTGALFMASAAVGASSHGPRRRSGPP